MPMSWQLPYLAAINLLAWALTVWDKHRARLGRWRVSEATLLMVAALGGSPTMYLTMRRIHHKTRHRKFMWGLPVIFALQAALWYLFMG